MKKGQGLKSVCILLTISVIALFCGCQKVNKSKKLVNAQETITRNDNYLLLNINEKVRLCDLIINMDGNDETGDTYSWKPEGDELEVSDGCIRAKTYGLFNIVISKGQIQYEIYAISKNKSENDYVVFQSNFSSKKQQQLGEELTDNYTRSGTELEGNSAKILNNELVIENRREGGTNTTVSVLPKVKQLGNYQLSVDFVLDGYSKDAKALFGVKNDNENKNSYLFSVCENPISPYGVTMSTVKGGVVEPFSRSGEYVEQIENKLTNVKIVCKNSRYALFLNSKLICANEDTSLGYGGVYIGCDNGLLRVKSIKITVPPDNIENNIKQPVNLAELQSNIKSMPAIFRRINTSEDLFECTKEERPGCAILKVNDKLEVVGAENQKIDSIDAIIDYLENKVVPFFYVENGQSAKALANYIKSKYSPDDICGGVMSSDPALVRLIREQCPNLSGIVDCYGSDLKEDERKEKYDQICTNIASGILINEKSMTKDNIDFFQKRFVCVYGECSVKDADYAVYVLKSGISGVVTADSQKLMAIAKRMPENSTGRLPYVIGTNYDTSDIIRLGVIETNDNKLLGIKGNIDALCVSKLENLNLGDAISSDIKNNDNSSFSKMDLDGYLKNIDSDKKSQLIFAFNLLGNKSGDVELLRSLLVEHQMVSDSVVVSPNSQKFTDAKMYFSSVSRCADYANSEGRQVLDFHKVAMPLLTQNGSAAIITLADDTMPILFKYYGLMCIKDSTMDLASLGYNTYSSNDMVTEIEPWESYQIKVGEKTSLGANGVKKNGDKSEVKVTAISVDDNEPGMTVDADGKVSAVKSGTTRAVLVYSKESKTPSGRYSLFSDVVTIKAVE